MTDAHFDPLNVRVTFEKCWRKLVREYPKYRAIKSITNLRAYWYESDIQLHLARLLMNDFPPEWVHQESLLRPIDIRRRERRGRKPAGYQPDIVIYNPDENKYYIIAELKWVWCTYEENDLKRRQQRHKGRELSKNYKSFYLGHLSQLEKWVDLVKAQIAYLCVLDELYPDISKRLKRYSSKKVKILADYVSRTKINRYIRKR